MSACSDQVETDRILPAHKNTPYHQSIGGVIRVCSPERYHIVDHTKESDGGGDDRFE